MSDRGDTQRGEGPADDLPAAEPVVGQTGRAPGSRAWYLLLALPFMGLLWVPLYASEAPKLLGFPFFYWYQFAWVPVTAALTWIVFARTR